MGIIIRKKRQIIEYYLIWNRVFSLLFKIGKRRALYKLHIYDC